MLIKPRSASADFHSAQRLKMKSEPLLVLALSLCVSSKPLSKRRTYNKLLLISFDGFRWDYDQNANTPNLYIFFFIIIYQYDSILIFSSGRWTEDHGVVHNLMFNDKTGLRVPHKEVYDSLKNAHPNLTVYMQEEIPEHFHIYTNMREFNPLSFWLTWSSISTLVILHINKGDHGFSNEEMDMKMIFRAFGPDFRDNFLAEPIYLWMCKLWGVVPEANNGRLSDTKYMLVDNFDAGKHLYGLSEGVSFKNGLPHHINIVHSIIHRGQHIYF
uniref:Zgc:153896 n=1 Tax=Cyprinus carpio TaxID=7962 RepID=A0A8C1SMJ6_CYPCA